MTEPGARVHEFALVYAEEDLGPVPASFTVTPSADSHGVVVEGVCPRCHGRTSTEYRYGAPGTGTKGLWSWLSGRQPVPDAQAEAALLQREPLFCECGHPHADLPQDAPFTGCGASWRIGSPATGGAS
ncbi:hypothetical protein ACIQHU_31205 [Streptomyces tendae]|uniref:hypothetical protein n=1 Tax=Streptomyces tendae TaxID=1932 RepID=UPI0034383856